MIRRRKIKEIGVSSRGMYIRNIADITPKWEDFNADIMPNWGGRYVQYCRYTTLGDIANKIRGK